MRDFCAWIKIFVELNMNSIISKKSPLTATYWADTFAAYRSIPSFQEYLLIDQYRLQVQQYSKTDGNKWIFSEYSCEGDRVSLTSMPVEFSVGDLYENIEFDAMPNPA